MGVKNKLVAILVDVFVKNFSDSPIVCFEYRVTKRRGREGETYIWVSLINLKYDSLHDDFPV